MGGGEIFKGYKLQETIQGDSCNSGSPNPWNQEPHGNEQNKQDYNPLDIFSVESSLKFRNGLICISLNFLEIFNNIFYWNKSSRFYFILFFVLSILIFWMVESELGHDE